MHDSQPRKNVVRINKVLKNIWNIYVTNEHCFYSEKKKQYCKILLYLCFRYIIKQTQNERVFLLISLEKTQTKL